MPNLVNVKRATKNQLVKADVTGTGEWVVGRILDFDKTHITFIPNDGSAFVKMIRAEVYKATEEEFKNGLSAPTANQVHYAKPEVDETDEFICPHCGTDTIDNGLLTHGDNVNGDVIKLEQFQYNCMACGNEFGPEIKQSQRAKTDLSGYIDVRAASGRKSKDIGDEVAKSLRGKSLEDAYKIAANVLEVGITTLKAKYKHLNPGQQRMILGNRIRAKFNTK